MLIQSVKKEAILIANDLHSVAVLLLLPIVFMVIMTLALSEKQSALVEKISISISGQQHTSRFDEFNYYVAHHGFNVVDNKTAQADVHITFEPQFDQALLLRQSDGQLRIEISDKLSPQIRTMVGELLKMSISKLKLHAYMDSMGSFDFVETLSEQAALVNQSADVDYLVTFSGNDTALTQPALFSIPSWMVFGIYFIVLPISITLINERQNGTLIRIRTYPITTTGYFINKALSYGLLSLLQWGLLSVIGLLVIPLILGQEPLAITNAPLYGVAGLFVVLSAISFAFLLASLVSTFDQAIVLGGGVNILMAALSGFMVPIDVMPDVMASIATFSPMYWAAEVMRQGLSGEQWLVALSNLFKLLVFSVVCFCAALFIFNKKSRKLLWN